MTIRVIFADDHPLFLEGLAPLLEMEHDIEIVALAGNGREAWECIQALRPDVAILDISMPVMTGIEVARKVTAAGLGTQMLMLTMHDDPGIAQEALDAGALGYLIKDNTFEELVEAVRTVAGGGAFVSPSIGDRLRRL